MNSMTVRRKRAERTHHSASALVPMTTLSALCIPAWGCWRANPLPVSSLVSSGSGYEAALKLLSQTWGPQMYPLGEEAVDFMKFLNLVYSF